MTTTEILDALVKSLENRNREFDDDLTTFWADWIRLHAEMLDDDD